MIDRARLALHRAQLVQQEAKLAADMNAVRGAMQLVDGLMAELDTKEEPKPAPKVVNPRARSRN